MAKDLVAAIDVGSHMIRMKIGELDEKGSFRELESYVRIANLGHDTFTTGKVSFDSVDTVCEILKDFKNSMNDYGIDRYKAMATSALREAANKAYILDQIKLKTGLDIEVIDNAQEQYLTYKAVKDKLPDYDRMIDEGAVMVVIGAGSIQITTYKNGGLTSSQNVKMGALRIKEILNSLEKETVKYNKLLKEYIAANLQGLDLFSKNISYRHFIAVGGEISIIKRIIELEGKSRDDNQCVSKAVFEQLLRSLADKTTEEICRSYDVNKERASILLPSMMLFIEIMNRTEADRIDMPASSLSDGIIKDIYEDIYNLNKKEKTFKDVLTNAKVIAAKFEYDEKHSEAVERYCMTIFDKTAKLHGLTKERILLRLAAILHDCGKFISLDMHHLHSYAIIRSLELFGMSKEQMEIVANVSRYHSFVLPSDKDRGYSALSDRNKVIVSKLVAIIRLADALDRSHKQKLEITSVKIVEKELIIKSVSEKNTKLEEWNFSKKAEFFSEVFGLRPILIVKKEI